MTSANFYGRRLCLIVVLCLTILYAGCISSGQKQQIERFAVSSDVMVEGSRTALELARDSEREYMISEAIKRSDLRPQYFTPLLDKQAIRKRLELLRVFDLYVEGLRLLVKDDESKELEDAALNLASSAESITKTLTKSGLTEDEKKLLGFTVNAIGQTIVEAMRGVSLRRTVKDSDENVKDFARLFSKDIGEHDPNKGTRIGLRAKIYREYTTRSLELEEYYKTLSSRQDKEKLIRRYVALLDERDQVDGLLGETRQSIQRFAEAHSELHNSLRWSNIFGSYKSLRDQVDAMVKHVRKIKEFQDRLKED